MKVTKNRSILKTISYRIVGFINTFLISFFVISYGSENFDATLNLKRKEKNAGIS